MVKYISPLTDWGFKKLFGEESSKQNLINFLNAVFHEEGLPWIESLELKKTEHLGNTEIDRTAIFDLYARGKNNERFVIELQKIKQKHFFDRSLFYSTYAIQDSAVKGQWNFKIDPVYVICILDFRFDNSIYIQDSASLIFKNRQTEMLENYRFFFLECPKIQLSLDQDSTKRDKWLYILKYIEQLTEEPQYLKNDGDFKEFLEEANLYKLKELDRADYQASLKYRYDLIGIEEENIEKGLKIGLEKGLQQGLQKGLEKGLQQGHKTAMFEMAKKLKSRHIAIEYIIEDTGLSEEEIKQL